MHQFDHPRNQNEDLMMNEFDVLCYWICARFVDSFSNINLQSSENLKKELKNYKKDKSLRNNNTIQ